MINLNAGINDTGYGCVASNIFINLYEKYPDMSLFPIGEVSIAKKHMENVVNARKNSQTKFDANNPSLRIWHQNNLAERYSKKLSSALTFFELDILNENEINHINNLDILFVASKWAKAIVEKHCSVRCEVVPMGADESIFYPTKQPAEDNKPYRFFSSGKIEIRKGHDILCDLFNKAFEKEDNVELYIKWDNTFLSPQETSRWEKLYKESKLGDKIVFVKTSSQKELANMFNFCDCGVFPSRTEGFGLNILEAIYCNKPVITTNYSAITEFCNADNATLCDPDGLEPANDGRWFFGQGQWAHLGPNFSESVVDAMRRHYNKGIRTNAGRPATMTAHNWGVCTEVLSGLLQI